VATENGMEKRTWLWWLVAVAVNLPVAIVFGAVMWFMVWFGTTYGF
jgi:hypothetical protein